jgi:hypothetical protein
MTAFVDVDTAPRANLDVVGNAFISGKIISDYLSHPAFANRTETTSDYALLVGGDSATPANEATLRVATTNNGRVGINVTNAELDRALVVDGTSRFTDDARFEHDIEVNGDDGVTAEIRTSQTSGIFNLVTDATFTGTLNIGNSVETLNLLNTTTEDQFVYVGNKSLHSNIWIGNTPDLNSNISKITIGGAYNNNESLSFTQIDTKALKVSGDIQLGTRRGLNDTVKLSSTAGTVEFFAGNSSTSKLDFATNASDITVGGQGGSTKIRNNLIVDSTARFNSDMTLCGGFASYSFTADRGQIGSSKITHTSGILGNNLFQSNVDLITVTRVAVSDARYNAVDTSGSGDWGGTVFQNEITTIGGTPSVEPQVLSALSGNQYYLPIKNKPVDAAGAQYFTENDILLVDTAITGNKHPEFVKIVSLPRINVAPYYIIVERLPFGTFTEIRSDHNDTAPIYKCTVQFESTWITTNLDNSGTEENIYLAQFGGDITIGDYVIISRDDGTPSGDGVDDTGEIFKVKTLLDQVAKSFRIKNGCDTSSESTVFEINSVTGDVFIDSNETTINGTLSLNGVCGDSTGAYPSPDPSLDNHLTISNTSGPVWDVNMCNGDMTVGSVRGTTFGVGQYWGSTGIAHTKTSVVHSYRFRKETLNAQDGPISTVSVGFTTDDWNIPIDDLTGFSKGDLVLIYSGSTQGEIILVTDDPYINGTQAYLPTIYNAEYPASTYPIGGRGAEGSGKQNWNAGAVVVKLAKYTFTTTLDEDIAVAASRTAVESPNLNADKIRVKLVDSRLIANKLDTDHFFRIVSGNTLDTNRKNTDQEWFWADSIDSQPSSYGVRLAKSTQTTAQATTGDFTAYFGGGTTTINDAVEIYSGEFRMYGSDKETLVMSIANDDDHPNDGSVLDPKTGFGGLYLDGQATFDGILQLRAKDCESTGICTTEVTFRASHLTGNLEMGEQLYIKGKVVPTDAGDSGTAILHIDNLGGAGVNGTEGPRDFKIYQDCSIDAFGISRYFTRNGGRRYTYVEQSLTGVGQTQAAPLQPNNNYLLNNPAGTNMVLYLPDYAETGDMIRFVEVSGNLTYNTNLVLRALKVNNQAVALQGDTTGSKIEAGSGTLASAWDSGELIVQTRNASFGLVYVGVSDAAGDPNASSIPANLRGWWLTEL